MTKPTKEERKKHNAYYPSDTEFSALARLLQSKWREKKSYEPLKLGNFLDVDFAKETRANFLTEKIKELVTSEIKKAKKEGALIGEPRIWNNLLSSQPLCFNLFGELHYDIDKATTFFKKLFPGRVSTVERILFEHSPGRRNIEYTGDSSAFDVFVEYLNHKNEKCFIGIEVKYAESLKEETPQKANENFRNHETEYKRLTTEECFIPNAINYLQKVPLSQIWRDHLLSISMLKHSRNDYSEGFFVFLFPERNTQCQEGVNAYQKYLLADNKDKSKTGFYPEHLETFINALIETYKDVPDNDWTKELKQRYLGND